MICGLWQDCLTVMGGPERYARTYHVQACSPFLYVARSALDLQISSVQISHTNGKLEAESDAVLLQGEVVAK